jgi:hypothetical protein
VEPDLVEPDLVEPDLVEPDLVEPDLVEPDLVEPDLVEPDGGGADAAAGDIEDVAEPVGPACIASEEDAWSDTGAQYCGTFGLYCSGVDYFGSSGVCVGTPNAECWTSNPLACCLAPMSGHAGSPAGVSAMWVCGDACPEGSEEVGDTCDDIDECALGIDDCHVNATCTNVTGSYTCACNEEFTGNGVDCEFVSTYEPDCIQSGDLSWSQTGHAYCGDFDLVCAGTAYYGSSPTCEGDPYSGCWGSTPLSCCASPMSGHAGAPAGASALWDCVEDCPAGSEKSGDVCVDVDECTEGTDDCSDDATCINKQGTYQCLCNEGFTGDGQTCEPTNPESPACITSGDTAWTWSGTLYCEAFELVCAGVAYYGSDAACAGAPDTGCWGGDVDSCCGAPMSGHAGSPPGVSALWTCVP